ncbi:MAG: diguanylate cyclase domain-containing protein [Desulfovibrio sp.]
MQKKYLKSLDDSNHPMSELKQLTRYLCTGLIVWTFIIGLSTYTTASLTSEGVLIAARIQARSAVERDVLFRHWNAILGGVYFKVTDDFPPNPHLTVPERDIISTEGDVYTLINPSYMTRLVHELGQNQGLRGHLTSLNPVRPENLPDSWERQALISLSVPDGQNGGYLMDEVSSVEDFNGEPFMRLMKPMVATKDCLRCHDKGVQEGDVLGGLSVGVPMLPLQEFEKKRFQGTVFRHVGIWFLGVLTILYGSKRIRDQIKQRMEVQEIIRKQAVLDPLTNLPNRRLFFEQLNRDFSRAERENSILALLYLDLDGFKAVNDNYGHNIGDELLLKVSRELLVSVREEDTVARVGGDEFCIILPHLEDVKDADVIAQRIIDAFFEPVEVAGHVCDIGVSIGISSYPETAKTPDELVHHADANMYRVKKGTKNAFCRKA